MASSLAKQLSRIRVADRAAGSEKSQLYKASFLFDPRQAANLDVQTIYDIGRNGLSELCSMNGRFAYYSKTLFSEAVKHMDRILQTKKDNEMLDNSIRGFLRELAPYFLTKPAGKALEWLIRRFRIHEFNVRDVLGAFMPYHETKAFSNLLLILHFSPEDMRTFKFLVAQRKSRHPLDRKTLVQQCIHDRSILAFIIDWSIEAARADQSYPVLLSFLATLVSQYIGELPRIDDSALQFIVPYVVKALRLGREELQLAGYIILTALASRISFSKEVLDELAGVMVATSVDLRSTLLCLAQLAHLQPQLAKEFPAEAAARLGERNDVQEALNQLREGYHVGVLCDSLLVTLADNIFADPSHAKLLQALVESSLITSASAAKVCPVLLRRYLDLGFEAAKAGDAVGAAHELLQTGSQVLYLFQTRFPAILKKCISDEITEHNEGRHTTTQYRELSSKMLYDLASRDSADATGFVVPLKETRATMLASLTHTESAIRLVAARHLTSMFSKDAQSDEGKLQVSKKEAADLLTEALTDEDEEVLKEALSCSWAKFADPESLLLALERALAVTKPRSEQTYKSLFAILLSEPIVGDKARRDKVVSLVFPYLLPTKTPAPLTKPLLAALKDSTLDSSQGLLMGFGDIDTPPEHTAYISDAVAKLAQNAKNLGMTDLFVSTMDFAVPSAIFLAVLADTYKLILSDDTESPKFYSSLLLLVTELKDTLVKTAPAVTGLDDSKVLALAKPAASTVGVHRSSADSLRIPAELASLIASEGPTPLVQRSTAAFALLALISKLELPKTLSKDGWFPRAADNKEYRDAVAAVYTKLMVGPRALTILESVIVAHIFERCLAGEWVQFLASTWTTHTEPIVRARSLLVLRAFLQSRAESANGDAAQTVDYQVLLPALLIALANCHRNTRAAACECIRTLSDIYGEPAMKPKNRKVVTKSTLEIYKYDAFYGVRSSELQFLPTYVFRVLVFALASKARELTEDARFLAGFLSSTLSQGTKAAKHFGKYYDSVQESVPPFILSHVVALRDALPEIQIALLGLLDGVVSPAKFEVMLPVVKMQIDRLRKQSAVPADSSEEDKLFTRYILTLKDATASDLDRCGADGGSCWSLIMDLVEGPKNDGDGDSGGSRHAIELYLQRRAIDLLTTPLLKSLGGDHQRALVHRLLRILATQDHIHHGDAAVAKGIKGILDRLPLDPGLPAQDIEAFASELQALTDDSSRSAKKGRMEGGRSVAQRASNVVYKLVALLEFVQTKGTVSHSPLLALPLFTALSAMLDINVNHALGRPESDSQQPAPPLPIEYTKQLIIDILLHIFRETSRGGVKVDESMLRVDTLVQVIRTSTSPQTHNQSLLLLSAIAEQHPQLVLHHMMAIFTFMGANIFRQDDNYSFHVIQQAIEKIISPLVKSTSVTSDDTETDLDRASRQIRPVLEVFVDSLTHIPRHRRLILFATVVKTTGPRHFLYAMLGLLLEKQARRQSKPTAEDLLSSDAANSTSQPALEAGVKGRDDVADFALALAHQFSAADQLHALIQLQRDLLRLPAERQSKDQPDAYTEGLGLIDISHMSSRQLRAYRFLVLHFSNRLLTSAPFLSRLQEDADASNLVGDDVPPEQIPSVTNDRRFTELVESLLRVITSIGTLYAQLVAAAAAKNTHLSAPVEHAWKQILHEAYTTLGTTNNLLALPHFVATVNMLLAHENRTIRRKVLDLTNQRVASIGESGTRSKETVASILALLQPIQSLINDTSAAAAVETATNKQAALLCLTTLTRYFAAANPSEFVDIISTAIGPGGLGHANSQVVASAIVTLTHLVLELGPRAVPTLPKYMPIVLKHVSEGVLAYPTATSSQLTLLVGSLSALGAIAKKMASFVHPSLPALLSSLLHSNLNDSSAFKGGNKPLERRNVSDDAKLREHARAKVQAILATIAESVSPRHLLPAQFNYFQKEALKNGADSTVSLLNFVGLTASSMSRSTMSQFYKPMFKFFLIVFDTRRLHLSSNELAVDDIDQVEDAALDAFIKFVVKLSEKLFKPLFSSLVDWASAKLQGEDDDKDNEASSSDSPSVARLTIFYRIINKLLMTLQSLATPYYSSVLDLTVQQLKQYSVTGDSVEAEEEERRNELPTPDRLWREVVTSIKLCAEYDSSNFWNNETFTQVYKPLADQLPNTKVNLGVGVDANATDVYLDQVKGTLAPAMGQLVVAIGNDAMWKMINSRVMFKTRSEDAATRMGSLHVLQEFYRKLGEEFLILLPETIPFLAELMEDDDPRVERLTQETLHLIESYLGESLQSYFQ